MVKRVDTLPTPPNANARMLEHPLERPPRHQVTAKLPHRNEPWPPEAQAVYNMYEVRHWRYVEHEADGLLPRCWMPDQHRHEVLQGLSSPITAPEGDPTVTSE